jgi:hypothetical protein
MTSLQDDVLLSHVLRIEVSKKRFTAVREVELSLCLCWCYINKGNKTAAGFRKEVCGHLIQDCRRIILSSYDVFEVTHCLKISTEYQLEIF